MYALILTCSDGDVAEFVRVLQVPDIVLPLPLLLGAQQVLDSLEGLVGGEGRGWLHVSLISHDKLRQFTIRTQTTNCNCLMMYK